MTLRFWFRPAVLVFFWMVVSAFTLAELATVPSVLASVGREQPASQALRGRSVRARGAAVSQRVVVR